MRALFIHFLFVRFASISIESLSSSSSTFLFSTVELLASRCEINGLRLECRNISIDDSLDSEKSPSVLSLSLLHEQVPELSLELVDKELSVSLLLLLLLLEKLSS
jgi:hypothetical protein